jgi:hypothetical protein
VHHLLLSTNRNANTSVAHILHKHYCYINNICRAYLAATLHYSDINNIYRAYLAATLHYSGINNICRAYLAATLHYSDINNIYRAYLAATLHYSDINNIYRPTWQLPYITLTLITSTGLPGSYPTLL